MPEASKTRKNEAKATVIFDRDSLSHRLMDDIELMKQVVEHFTLDMPEQLELLQQAILDSDTEAIARLRTR